MKQSTGRLLVLFVYSFAILIENSRRVQSLIIGPTTNNGPCAPGFEKKQGSCQPCKPRYFKNSTMTGMNCMECDYVKNQYQVEYCPCTSVQNSVIVCRSDDSEPPSSFCKKRSEVQESCTQQGGLQNLQREANSSAVLNGDFNMGAVRDWSGTPPPLFLSSTVAPVGDLQLNDAGPFNSTWNVLILTVAVTVITVSAIVSGVYITRMKTGRRVHGRKQPIDAARNAEQAAHLLMASANEEHGHPANLLMHEIEANLEEPHSAVRLDPGPVNDDSRDFDVSVSSLLRTVDIQLDFENSVALHTDPVSDRHAINFDVASVVP